MEGKWTRGKSRKKMLDLLMEQEDKKISYQEMKRRTEHWIKWHHQQLNLPQGTARKKKKIQYVYMFMCSVCMCSKHFYLQTECKYYVFEDHNSRVGAQRKGKQKLLNKENVWERHVCDEMKGTCKTCKLIRKDETQPVIENDYSTSVISTERRTQMSMATPEQ